MAADSGLESAATALSFCAFDQLGLPLLGLAKGEAALLLGRRRIWHHPVSTAALATTGKLISTLGVGHWHAKRLKHDHNR